MSKFGVDISKWQGDFNIAKAKEEGVKFVIAKIGQRTSGIDPQFDANYRKCKENNIPIGCYFYGTATTLMEAEYDANYWETILCGYEFDMPVFYDVEGSMLRADTRTLTDIVKTVLGSLKAKGYAVGIYASESVFNAKLYDSELSEYYHWVAKWSTKEPTLNSGLMVDLWQFGGETNLIRDNKIAGVTCDQDYCYIEIEKKEPVVPEPSTEFKPFLIQAKTPMNVRTAPGVENKAVGQIDGKYKYTIVETAKASDGGTWGLLKSGMGWINVSDKYVNKFDL